MSKNLKDLGFTVKESNTDELIIFHRGKQAANLRGSRARELKADLDASTFGEQQQLLARLTGNYKRGNERTAKNHPRNR
jgi:hypothetical protein